jgi:ATP-binding cassette subfamily B protein
VRPLIEHLDLVASPGQTIAIVGPPAPGKTTLAQLSAALLRRGRRRITLDGVDVSDMRREDLRAQFGMVLQDTWLFGGSIRRTSPMAQDEASDGQISAAARRPTRHVRPDACPRATTR